MSNRAQGRIPSRALSYRMLANSLLMRFSSSSRALAFLKSAMNWTRPRMFELLLLERPRNPVDDILDSKSLSCLGSRYVITIRVVSPSRVDGSGKLAMYRSG